MKHAPLTPPYIPINNPPNLTPMTDQDWEDYFQLKLDEEADFVNATTPLAEKLNG